MQVAWSLKASVTRALGYVKVLIFTLQKVASSEMCSNKIFSISNTASSISNTTFSISNTTFSISNTMNQGEKDGWQIWFVINII